MGLFDFFKKPKDATMGAPAPTDGPLNNPNVTPTPDVMDNSMPTMGDAAVGSTSQPNDLTQAAPVTTPTEFGQPAAMPPAPAQPVATTPSVADASAQQPNATVDNVTSATPDTTPIIPGDPDDTTTAGTQDFKDKFGGQS